jgi:PAS domain S-box-containing protein
MLEQKAGSLEAEIEQRQRAEAAAREEQAKLAMAVGVAQLGIWELDLKTRFFTSSDTCRAQFGLAPSEPFTYARFLQLIHPDDREAVRTAFHAATVARENYAAEFRVIDPAGRLRWIACMGRYFQNGAQRMIGATLDITERKRAAEILEQTVLERTARLQECIADLETFSCSISHDMRAPLQSMHGFASILTQEYAGKLDPQGRAYLEHITSSADRMDQLIEDVLNFSRATRSDLELESVDLSRLVRSVIESASSLPSSPAQIVIEGTLPCVLGNAASLTQCLSNLLDNALKYSPKEKPVDLSVKRDGSWLSFAVLDRGPGVPEEDREAIFAPFYRRAGVPPDTKGAGLGLSIARALAEAQGARLEYAPRAGGGSVFTLRLPAIEVAEA